MIVPASFGTSLLVAAVIAVLLLATLSLLWYLRRSEKSAEERVNSVVRELSGRMDALGTDVAEALSQAQEETRRSRFVGELGSSIDLDEVVSRTLDAAFGLAAADAVMLRLTTPAGEIVTESIGLSAQELEEVALAEPPASPHLRTLSLGFDTAPGAGAIASGVAVPIRGDAGCFGLLTVFSRSEEARLDEQLAVEVEALAKRAAPAIENARRFREVRQQADLDALTGLHNRRYFHETLAREVARAHRYTRDLALIVFDLDDFKAVNDRIGHLAGDHVLAEVAERVRDVVRSADIACRVGGDEFGVILPESSLEDADQLYERLQAAAATRPVNTAGALTLSAGVTELRPDDDPVSFFQRADEALYRAKHAGKGRIVAANSGASYPDPAVSS